MQLSDHDEAVGAQGVPLTPGRSIAVDRSLHVYGTPFFIEGELPIESAQSKNPFRRLMIAQDTGSAIIGPARADLYFGAGLDAGKVAGRLRHSARFVMLVPKSLDPVARGRKLPVPDDRPSAKIAKLFPQTVPTRDPSREQKATAKSPEVDRPRRARPAAQAAPPSAATSAGDSGCRGQAGATAGAAAEGRSDFRQSRHPRHLRRYRSSSMKRRPSSLIPELPEPPRRKRGLSEEDRALWELVAKQVKPLRKRQRAPKPPAVAPAADDKGTAKPVASPRHAAPARIVAPSKPAPPPLSPIGRRERSHLSRGRKEIDARLDLHGMTQTRAHRALFGFLQRAHHDGLSFVLIITGKGKVGAENRARRIAPAGAAMARAAGIPLAGGRLRGSPYRPRRRGRAVCPGAAGADLERPHDSDTRDQRYEPAERQCLSIIG